MKSAGGIHGGHMAIGERRAAGVLRRTSWRRAYALRLFLTDLAVIALVVFGTEFIWFGFSRERLETIWTPNLSHLLGFNHTGVSIVLVIAWMLMLDAFATRDHKVIGSGALEYKRVADATIRLFGLLAILAYLLNMGLGLGRGYFLTALPAGLILLIFFRWFWRQWLRQQQRAGGYVARALLVGERVNSEHVAHTVRLTPGAGLHPVAALTRDGLETPLSGGIPVIGGYDDVISAIERTGADSVVMTGSDDIGADRMRKIGWSLAELDVELIVAPAMTDVGGPRIHARPLTGLPLIHVEFPSLEGIKRVSKRTFDIFVSLVVGLLFLPVLIAIAFVVKYSTPGPILYRQERIGRGGMPFGMYKFRSMVQGADDQLASLLDLQGTADQPLFKVNNDPRITPVGRFLRRYSLDEAPQLINVLLGQMSLVGPRPQRAAEVALYDDVAQRRLVMKPGMSGLWQVSGRSALAWEDAIRLDLYYVENWSLTVDLLILWRTVHAVIVPRGAV
jgi:exopolysaccharide biosynthesis polyprenyl glycosylphosphotransferase